MKYYASLHKATVLEYRKSWIWNK